MFATGVSLLNYKEELIGLLVNHKVEFAGGRVEPGH